MPRCSILRQCGPQCCKAEPLLALRGRRSASGSSGRASIQQDSHSEEMKIAYPTLLFDRNIIEGRGMMCSFLTLAIGNNQGHGLRNLC